MKEGDVVPLRRFSHASPNLRIPEARREYPDRGRVVPRRERNQSPQRLEAEITLETADPRFLGCNASSKLSLTTLAAVSKVSLRLEKDCRAWTATWGVDAELWDGAGLAAQARR